MKKFFFMCLVIFISAIKNFAVAAEIPAAPTENIYVADFAGMIDADTKNKILQIGGELDSKHKAQIVVVTVENLGESSIEEYANELFRNWGIGNKDLNNGVLLLISRDDRRFRIEVGYGLEGAITDGYAGEILDAMTNYFRDGNFSEGILTAYGTLTKKVYEEYGGEIPENLPAPKTAEEESLLDMLLGMLVFAICMVIFYFMLKYIFVLPIAVSVYIVAVIAYLVTQGKYGTLSFSSIYVPLTEYVDFRRFSFSSSGGSKSSGGGGYGGGKSGGGGSSGSW